MAEKQENQEKFQQKKEGKPFIQLENTLKKLLQIQKCEILDKKHNSCKHKNGCVSQIVDIGIRGFLIGIGLKGTIKILMFILKNKTLNPIKILHQFFSKDVIQFALTPAVYNIVLQGTTCLMRWFKNGETKKDAFISGFMAGFLCLLTKPKKDRQIWAVFLLTRAFQFYYNSLVNKNYIPKTKFDYVIIFSLMWFFLGSQCGAEQPNCAKSLNSFKNNITFMNEGDIGLYSTMMFRKNRKMYLKNGPEIMQDPANFHIKPAKQVQMFGLGKK
ncbi:hypothetical protein PPERSA_01709 [Pseudocohnilembus persalinus]|uniref:Transmembrane protein n=1 Tax=Pseudocohnilembus persalinus TaxID=266149 RepID=A0A0V0R0V1_PSEPJ|nr:hypothetical protein PPERSA_01709 [Pseudocohnilembus persalinus]|eukprot:KRX08164.1 hypothetical protein PPERSA_01709 [Pseudocohnilembus persalinus]